MPLIATAFGYDVNHAAGRTTILGLEAIGLNLDFLYELERNVVIGVQVAGAEIGNFLTVNNERVLRTARAVDLNAGRGRLVTNGRSHLQSGGEVCTLRQRRDLRIANGSLNFTGSRVNRLYV